MSQVIIYKQDNGQIAVVIPNESAVEKYGIMTIAIKDVPFGKKFAIVNLSDLPLNIPQEAWEVNDEDLKDGAGGQSNEFEVTQ